MRLRPCAIIVRKPPCTDLDYGRSQSQKYPRKICSNDTLISEQLLLLREPEAKKSQMPTTRLTDLTVRSLPMGTHFDATTPAFGIRVGKHRRTWIVMRGQERRRIRIGHYPSVTLSDARKEAKRLLAATHLSGKRVTFGEAYETFKTDYIARRKERTQKDYKRMIEKHFLPTLKSKRMDAISSYTLSAITDGLADTPSEQAHAQVVCRIFFRWAIRPQRRSA